MNEGHQLNLPPVWSTLKIGRSDTGKRIPATANHALLLLRPGALDGLNGAARGILWMAIDTDARPPEIAALDRAAIRLKDAVPQIAISSARRSLKAAHSAPLASLALAALRGHPEGLPRYFDKTASWSATVNKSLQGIENWPGGVTAYSFRHLFKDRLRAAGAPDSVINTLMGHKDRMPVYGLEYGLSGLALWIGKIAFTPPEGWPP